MSRRKLDEWGEDLVVALKWVGFIIVGTAIVGACLAVMTGHVITIR